MAYVELVVNAAALNGVVVNGGTVGTSDGWTFNNYNKASWLVVENVGVASRNITVVAQSATRGGADFANETVSITNGQVKMIGPFERAPFNTTASKVEINLPSPNEADLKGKVVECIRAN